MNSARFEFVHAVALVLASALVALDVWATGQTRKRQEWSAWTRNYWTAVLILFPVIGLVPWYADWRRSPAAAGP